MLETDATFSSGATTTYVPDASTLATQGSLCLLRRMEELESRCQRLEARVHVLEDERAQDRETINRLQHENTTVVRQMADLRRAAPPVDGAAPTPLQLSVLVVGGCTDTSTSAAVDTYDGSEWTEGTPMSRARDGVGCVVVGPAVYALGGRHGLTVLGCGEWYSPTTNRWTTVPSMQRPRTFMSCGVLGQRVYVAGGMDDHFHPMTDVEVYDPGSRQWSAAANLRTARAGAAGAVVNGKFYVIGGSGLKSGEVYDPLPRRWAPLPDMRTQRYQPGCAVYKGTMYVVGGTTGHGSRTQHRSLEMYHTPTQQWSSLPDMQVGRQAPVCVVIDSCLYVMGGRAGRTAVASIEVLDLATLVWRQCPEMPRAVAGAGIAVVAR